MTKDLTAPTLIEGDAARVAGPDLTFTVCYGVAVVGFVVTEISAIRSGRPGRTFTSQTRWVESHVPGAARWALRVAILGLTAWAGVHLAEGLQ